MANWTRRVQQARNLIESVECTLRENGVRAFEYVELHPFRGSTRTEGVTAEFHFTVERQTGHVYISAYEHWNTDEIDLRIEHNNPVNETEPHVRFDCNELDIASIFIQMFLLEYFHANMNGEFMCVDAWSGLTTASSYKIRKARNKLKEYKSSKHVVK